MFRLPILAVSLFLMEMDTVRCREPATVTREELTAELGKLTTKLTQLEDRLTAKRAEETEKLGKEIGQALGQTLGQTMIVGLEKLGQAMTVGLEKLGQTMTASVQKLGEAFATRDGVSKPVDSPGNQSVGFSGMPHNTTAYTCTQNTIPSQLEVL
ncbi:hypothetical protein BaRGS_00012190 [Batillaria attramentaria]|uniref:Uncharacterized protein n=1 Tax=Batillaria attramentaria TaxID=370345 RepID=A0ABD0LAY6_9CAEN